MRVPRIKEPVGGYYHVLSRVVDRRMALDDNEKERFRKLMRRTETFSGVRILTHSILDNHWHILIHVPAPRRGTHHPRSRAGEPEARSRERTKRRLPEFETV